MKNLYGVQTLTSIGLGEPGRRVRAIGLKGDGRLSHDHENTLFVILSEAKMRISIDPSIRNRIRDIVQNLLGGT